MKLRITNIERALNGTYGVYHGAHVMERPNGRPVRIGWGLYFDALLARMGGVAMVTFVGVVPVGPDRPTAGPDLRGCHCDLKRFAKILKRLQCINNATLSPAPNATHNTNCAICFTSPRITFSTAIERTRNINIPVYSQVSFSENTTTATLGSNHMKHCDIKIS
jgi:hypothetical protein